MSRQKQDPVTGGKILGPGLWVQLVPALRLWIVLAVLVGGTGIFVRLAETTSPWLDLGINLLMLLVVGVACWSARDWLRPLLTGFGLRGVSLLEPLAALAIIAAFFWVYFGLLKMLQFEEILVTDELVGAGWPLWTAYLLTGLLPAVTEELAFRGFIQSTLEKVGGRNEAIVVQAVMFSLLHLLPTIFISHFVFGLALGLLRSRSGSLYPGMLVHALWNSFIIFQESHQLEIL